MKYFVIAMYVALLAVSAPALAREKTDVIWLSNGDKLTGEIKQLEHGKLTLSTDSMGDVRIEWEDIARVQSNYVFQFEKTDGTRITGVMGEAPDRSRMSVFSGGEEVALEHANVVRIAQMDDNFWDRIQGSLSFGYSFTKASNVGQANLAFRTKHRTEIRSISVQGSTITTSDQDDDSTKRSDLSLNVTRFMPRRWFSSYLLGLESNDELGLDLRTSLGAGLGRYLVQTNYSELAVLGGVVGTAEALQQNSESTSSSKQENLEGLFGAEYSRYLYDHPKLDLSVAMSAFPSITDPGRLRSQLDISLRWEMIRDLFWDFSYYNTYDSDPPSGADSSSDYGVVTSIGYSY
ncbi:MAG: DUF481 domain-containing protein [Gammaproteobacteria bacterium]|nr:DUF481 domain-containing protein [Gammaproteobacteria bacterium]